MCFLISELKQGKYNNHEKSLTFWNFSYSYVLRSLKFIWAKFSIMNASVYKCISVCDWYVCDWKRLCLTVLLIELKFSLCITYYCMLWTLLILVIVGIDFFYKSTKDKVSYITAYGVKLRNVFSCLNGSFDSAQILCVCHKLTFLS